MDIGWCMYCDKQTANPEDLYCSAECRDLSAQTPESMVPSGSLSPVSPLMAITPPDSYFAPFMFVPTAANGLDNGSNNSDAMLMGGGDIRWPNIANHSHMQHHYPQHQGLNRPSPALHNHIHQTQKQSFALPPCSVKIVRPKLVQNNLHHHANKMLHKDGGNSPLQSNVAVKKSPQPDHHHHHHNRPFSLSRGHGYYDLTQLIKKSPPATTTTNVSAAVGKNASAALASEKPTTPPTTSAQKSLLMRAPGMNSTATIPAPVAAATDSSSNNNNKDSAFVMSNLTASLENSGPQITGKQTFANKRCQASNNLYLAGYNNNLNNHHCQTDMVEDDNESVYTDYSSSDSDDDYLSDSLYEEEISDTDSSDALYDDSDDDEEILSFTPSKKCLNNSNGNISSSSGTITTANTASVSVYNNHRLLQTNTAGGGSFATLKAMH
ncbi:hypothetical protein H4219_002160 [Mycoemilia scoparia]|uniref:Uncharacterized protein n=1 Tax=Mycoemilia scoparia TaxID=417184 RepID=A0A9W8A7K4_9FUNG|nr:hypothetical protein H4219_002160 [Mycoemilia scoparia]